LRGRSATPFFLIVLLSVISVIMLIPLFLMVATSLKSMGEIFSRGSFVNFFVPRAVHPENYLQALKAGDWSRYFANTVFVTAVTVACSLVINSLAGFAFSRLEFRGRDALFFASLVGLMIPPQASMVPTFLILKSFPLAGGNSILGRGGLGFINTYFGLMAPYLAGSFGVFLFRQYFLNFPKSLDDAAEIDGVTRMGAFLNIYVPLSLPVFASLMCLKATQTWNEYVWPLIITTNPKMMTLQLALVLFRSDLDTQWNLVMAATTLIVLPLVVLFVFAQKTFVAGIVTSGIKG
jgi:multiple sugar transport system permease protein